LAGRFVGPLAVTAPLRPPSFFFFFSFLFFLFFFLFLFLFFFFFPSFPFPFACFPLWASWSIVPLDYIFSPPLQASFLRPGGLPGLVASVSHTPRPGLGRV
jgi:hypothetical protein